MESEESKALRVSLSEICKRLNLTEVLVHLRELNVFTAVEIQTIKAITPEYERNREFVDHLQKKGSAGFHQFLEILNRCDQGDLAKIIQKHISTTISSKANNWNCDRAKVLIIANKGYSLRSGHGNHLKKAEEEVKILEDMWKVTFSIVPEVAPNLNLKKLKAKLADFAKTCSNDPEIDALLVFVIAKGGEDYVRCICERLQGKPKLFFIQNSYDDVKNVVNKTQAKDTSNPPDASESVYQLPSNTFIANTNGHSRWCCGEDANAEETFFIRNLVCIVKDNEQNNCCIERLLTKASTRHS
uniref:CARD domain-containing protein n=1 Tax=Plectus sambesii TaxID=2011161 RepID=A0A914VXQ1_9BILA